MSVAVLDEGRPCPGPTGGRWHDLIEVDGRTWAKGEAFFVLDRHGVPRPMKFAYHYTGTGSTVCYSDQRFKLPDQKTSVPCGFVDMIPTEGAVGMSRTELRVRQFAGDLIDIGLLADAEALIASLQGDADDIEVAEQIALALIEAHADDEDNDA